MLGSSTTTGTMPRVNLLPPEIAEKAAVRRSQGAMVLVGVAAVGVVAGLYMNASAKVNDANEAKAEAAAASAKLTTELNSLQNVRDVYAQVDAAKATLASAMSTEVLWSSYLHDLTLTIPDNVWLQTLTASIDGPTATSGNKGTTSARPVLDPGIGVVSFTGAGFHYYDVAEWLESLARQKGYSNAYFTEAAKHVYDGTDREVVKFTSSVNLTPAALSNRYAKGTSR
jgi:Tfp pilus assembly protein PilN